MLGVTAEAHRAARGALIATSAYDPDADETYSWTAEQYQALMGLGPRLSEAPDSFERLGAMQVTMGWLAYPRSYWATGEEALSSNDVVFPRVQHFRRVPPTYRAAS